MDGITRDGGTPCTPLCVDNRDFQPSAQQMYSVDKSSPARCVVLVSTRTYLCRVRMPAFYLKYRFMRTSQFIYMKLTRRCIVLLDMIYA